MTRTFNKEVIHVHPSQCFLFSWGGVRLSALGKSASNWPILLVPDDR
jgi:hypothetical protein